MYIGRAIHKYGKIYHKACFQYNKLGLIREIVDRVIFSSEFI